MPFGKARETQRGRASATPAPDPALADELEAEWPGPIEDASTRLREHEIEIEQGPLPRHGAKGRGTSVCFRDPEGSLLEFISYVA